MLCVCMCVCVTSVRVNPHTEHIILTGHDRLVRAVSFLFCYVYTPWFHNRVLEGSRRACVSSSLPDGKSFLNHIKEFLSRNWAPKLKVSRSFFLVLMGEYSSGFNTKQMLTHVKILVVCLVFVYTIAALQTKSFNHQKTL